MSKKTWAIVVMKVIKRERGQATVLALGGKCQKDRSGRYTQGRGFQTAECACRDKIVYWYCSLNIFCYQLLDN
jgi:uncharacterized protein YjhX (UPF0386 family)